MSQTKIFLGKIVSSHGVKGLFSLNLYNQNPVALNDYLSQVFVENQRIDIRVKFKKASSLICESSLFKSRDDLENFIGKEIWIEESYLGKTQANEFYHKDIIGCNVLDANLKNLGKVKAIHDFGAGDLLELDNQFKYMIRFYDLDKTKDINLKKKTIILNPKYEF